MTGHDLLIKWIKETYPLMDSADYEELDFYDMQKFAVWVVKNNAVLPHVSGSLPLIDVEEIKGLKDSLHKTGYTTYNHTRGGLRFINDLLDKLIMFHGNDR